jgi:hypothetical protein
MVVGGFGATLWLVARSLFGVGHDVGLALDSRRKAIVRWAYDANPYAKSYTKLSHS